MDELTTQEVKRISHEIVRNEFPDEEEYFDFLFDLTIQEIEELEPGRETEFLREMRAVHPELVLGYTPIIIILTVQILGDFTHGTLITEEIIKKRIESISESKEILGLSKYFARYRDKEKEKRKEREEKNS
ncbi:MAG: hypothetical protein HXS44_01705 [Theionarchaea archaeon]|nr:hypothetical protein [Theionarchaea archaeon]